MRNETPFEYWISGSWLLSGGIFFPGRHYHLVITATSGESEPEMMELHCSEALGTCCSECPRSHCRSIWKETLNLPYIRREKSQGLALELEPILAGEVHLCSCEEKEVFKDSVRLLFIIKPQQDFMIIFITSSFKTLGAMKVNNLCLSKLRELCRHYLIQQHHRIRKQERGKGWTDKMIPI